MTLPKTYYNKNRNLNLIDMNIEVLLVLIYVLVLATFVGFELIAKVPPTLHTPLMSGSNAISGITVIGALICAGPAPGSFPIAKILGMLALILATINVVGGYMVTDRMLKMFKKKK
jgi:H+-translocating NAD(P) transhydrogenase subunit alpha